MLNTLIIKAYCTIRILFIAYTINIPPNFN